MQFAYDIFQCLVGTLQRCGNIGDLLKFIAILRQAFNFVHNAFEIFILGCVQSEKFSENLHKQQNSMHNTTQLTLDNFQTIQGDLVKELVFVGIQSGGHCARTCCAIVRVTA